MSEIGEFLSRLAGFIIILISTLIIYKRPIQKKYNNLTISTIAFLAYCALHIPFGNSITENIATFIRIFGAFSLLFAFLTIRNQTIVTNIESLIFSLGLACAVYTIFQLILFKANPTFAINLLGEIQYWGAAGETVRPRGLLVSVGGSASLMATSLLVFLRKTETKKATRLEYLAAAVVVIGLAIGFTRTFILLLMLFSLIYFTLTGRIKKLTTTALLLLVTIFSYSIYSPEKLAERISDLPFISDNNTTKDELFKGRFYLSELALNEYKAQPAINWLWGNDLNFSTNIITGHYSMAGSGAESSTHNDIVWLLVNLGIIGLILYAALIYQLLKICKGPLTKLRLFSFLYVLLFFFLSSLAGESINITGHRYIQVIFIAILFSILRQKELPKAINAHGGRGKL